jgi:hypothetical protein
LNIGMLGVSGALAAHAAGLAKKAGRLRYEIVFSMAAERSSSDRDDLPLTKRRRLPLPDAIDFTHVIPADVSRHLFARFFLPYEHIILRHVCRAWGRLIRVPQLASRGYITTTLADLGLLKFWKWAAMQGYGVSIRSGLVAIEKGHFPIVQHIIAERDSLFRDDALKQRFCNHVIEYALRTDSLPLFRCACCPKLLEAFSSPHHGRALHCNCDAAEIWPVAIHYRAYKILQLLLDEKKLIPCHCPSHQWRYYSKAFDCGVFDRELMNWLYSHAGFQLMYSTLYTMAGISLSGAVLTEAQQWLMNHGCPRPQQTHVSFLHNNNN